MGGSDPAYQPGGGLQIEAMAEKPDAESGLVPPSDSHANGVSAMSEARGAKYAKESVGADYDDDADDATDDVDDIDDENDSDDLYYPSDDQAYPSDDTAVNKQAPSSPSPPTDVSSGMSSMSPGVADVEESHIAGSNPRTNDEGSSDTMPEGTKGASKQEGWQSTNHIGATSLEADEPSSSSFSIDPTFFTIGGLLVVVGLAAFVVYSRQTRGIRYHPVHEAI